MSEKPSGDLRQRIDKWLFFTRMAKSRSLAQGLLNSGHVRVNGLPIRKPSFEVKIGDKVELSLERRDVILTVKAAGERRGPYEEARELYEDQTPSREETERLSAFDQAQRIPGSGRPTKKERRETDRLFPEVGGPDIDWRDE
ncbi:RNA-binding S4 domain-containing protein [Rhizobiales bacterium RZME27]|uniref:RNA-binding S4 domain-containing protein n=1 Tax=Endobacterium cereale TaxID=2663029 RepID=A0A6A8AE17_9HYPH|nr:RNA-binding S4 domain-containing protein [Endobacterium cereale]MEB2847551.1 RNA-binding S4 domain-containing protein [Endobacterium cereale]MQY47990.1 RNA-binding S4 domain-containing protein [Endobacterium cereale]